MCNHREDLMSSKRRGGEGGWSRGLKGEYVSSVQSVKVKTYWGHKNDNGIDRKSPPPLG